MLFRSEQAIRAARAAALGLVKVLDPDSGLRVETTIAALHELSHQPLPSDAEIPGLLDGLDTINQRVKDGIESRSTMLPAIQSIV